MRRGAALLALQVLLPAALIAQVTPPRPKTQPPLPQLPVARDTGRLSRPGAPGQGQPRFPGDTTRKDTAATWLPEDETMRALLARKEYSTTRYEGNTVSFEAGSNAVTVSGGTKQRAQVERDGQRVDTDSLIVYKERHVDVNGKFRMTPGGGQPPIAGFGSATYDLSARSGRLTNAELTVDESGARWFVKSAIGKTALGDSTRGIPTRFYGLGGTLTSCDDSLPDYHFQMKEIKRTDRTLVARPAVMYIRDIPVMWLPFVFQDIRSGRRSGVLPPRFGVSDIVRNNPGYRRHVENVGYYFALNDYMDATAWVDWRSSAGGDSIDPGWYKANLEWKYTWLTRFLSGRLGTSFQHDGRDQSNTAVSWGHQQRFGQRTFSADVNYVSSTRLQRQNTFSTYQALSTIRSSFNYSDKIGPASLQLGGGRTQYPGRDQVDQDVPKLSISTAPLALFSWLVWTPAFSYQETSRLHMDTPWQFTQKFVSDSNGGLLRADSLDRSETDRRINLETPLKIFGYEFRTGVHVHDWVHDYPEERDVYLHADSAQRVTRVFANTFGTEVDWNPQIALPNVFQNRFKITPTVTLQNVDSRPFWVRSYLTGGEFVHQNKRFVYGVGASPTIFGIFPGFGPFSRIRHSITPTLSYGIAPSAKINPEYLAAVGDVRQRYLGTLGQSRVSLGLAQNIEAKVRRPADSSASPDAQKIKLLSMTFSAIEYDFERAKASGRKLGGLTTENFNSRVTSDLLPGMDFSLDYSLFRGSTITDTAEFDPFLTRLASTVRFSKRENPFTVIARLFNGPDTRGRLSRDSAQAQESGFARQGSQQVAGQGARGANAFYVPPVDGWQANLSLSMARSRPIRPGDNVINFDNSVRCAPLLANNFVLDYDRCMNSPTETPPPSIYGGTPQMVGPPQINATGDLRFALTQKWSATWNSSFDFVRHQFASQVVTLQRDMHDWRSVFAFNRASNGNFSFTFNIALKAQQDLKFDYSRASVRSR